MHKGFTIELSKTDEQWLRNYGAMSVRRQIAKQISKDDMLLALESSSANCLMDTWFKDYVADVFVSHSSRDADLAGGFAALLESVGLRVFVDSDLWGRVEKLQKLIDEKYALATSGNGRYDYNKRNITTRCVHTMLDFALMRMIDQTECFMFLGTPNSRIRSYVQAIETQSPWLFHELAVANSISERPLVRKRLAFNSAAMDGLPKIANESISLKFRAETPRLKTTTLRVASRVMDRSRGECEMVPQFALDRLYYASHV